jgi:hypothetical protein
MKTRLILALLASLLASCAPAIMPAPTQTSIPPTVAYTPVPPTRRFEPVETFTPTAEMTPISDVPTPLPTQLTIPILTPDATQVTKWKEYQTALAKSILPYVASEIVLCEWAILGQSGQEIYVWAVCDSGERASAPAIIYLSADGTIQNVKAVEYDATRNSQIQRLFPLDIQKKIFSELTSIIDEQLIRHLDERKKYPETPPLIVLSVTPTP